MKRYIDANLAKAVFTGNFRDEYPTALIHAMIDTVPTADVEKVRHGEWVKAYELLRPFCSECKAVCKDDYYTKYCHECGAKMGGGKE